MLTVFYFHAITGLPHTHALCMTKDVVRYVKMRPVHTSDKVEFEFVDFEFVDFDHDALSSMFCRRLVWLCQTTVERLLTWNMIRSSPQWRRFDSVACPYNLAIKSNWTTCRMSFGDSVDLDKFDKIDRVEFNFVASFIRYDTIVSSE